MIHTFESPSAVSHAFAQLLFERAKIHVLNHSFFNIAVSGGSTPKLLFEILAEVYKDTFPWNSLRVFWVDERCVLPSDVESNYKMTNDSLLSKISIPKENIFRMQGESIPADEALLYSDLLCSQLPLRNGIPVFDLILLGMGDDGHTASIFPSEMHLLECDELVFVATHPTSGQKRITLTGKTILAANEIAFLITGVSKAKVLGEILGANNNAINYPADYIQQKGGGRISFYLDAAAASQISK